MWQSIESFNTNTDFLLYIAALANMTEKSDNNQNSNTNLDEMASLWNHSMKIQISCSL